jgi:putative transposase
VARIARVVVPGMPHHVTQRGNHRAAIFFGEGDYRLYARYLKEELQTARVAIMGWCLMPNHCHLILVPANETGLAEAMGRLHWRYAKFVNARAGRTGHLFQERYGSVVMDESHLVAALAYADANPVRAGLVRRPEDWPWSSARQHLGLAAGDMLDSALPPAIAQDHAAALKGYEVWPETAALRRAEIIGRPAGSASFVAQIEASLRRKLAPGKRGRPRRHPEPVAA